MESGIASKDIPPSSNPYSVTSAPLDDADLDGIFQPRKSLLLTLGAWTLVCSISAIPSWMVVRGDAGSKYDVPMGLGVATFIVVFTAIDLLTQRSPQRDNANVKLSLRIVYGLRMVISFTPIGMGLDLVCGLISRSIVGLFVEAWPTRPAVSLTMSAGGVYFWTIVQGIVLNIVIAFAWVVIFGLLTLLRGRT